MSSLASKYQLRIAEIHKRGIKEEQFQWLPTALDRTDIAYMNPGKNENEYIGKLDGVKRYEQKRYFLWL